MASPAAQIQTIPQVVVLRAVDANRVAWATASPINVNVPKGGILKAIRAGFNGTGAVGTTATQVHDWLGAAAGTGMTVNLGGSVFAVDARAQAVRAIATYDRGGAPPLTAATAATAANCRAVYPVDFGYGPYDLQRGIPLDNFSNVRLSMISPASDGSPTTPLAEVDYVKIITGGPADPEFRQFVERDNFAAGTTQIVHNTLVGTPDKLVCHYITGTAFDGTATVQLAFNGSDYRIAGTTNLSMLMGEAIARLPGAQYLADETAAVTSVTFQAGAAAEMWSAFFPGFTNQVGTESAFRLKLDNPGQFYDTSVPTACQVIMTRPTSTVARFTEERLVRAATIGLGARVGTVAPAPSR